MAYEQAIAGPAQDVESKEMSPPPSWRYFVNGVVPDNRAGAQRAWIINRLQLGFKRFIYAIGPKIVRVFTIGEISSIKLQGSPLDKTVYAGLRIAIYLCSTGFVGHSSLRQKRQWTKNFLSSNFISAGRCSMSQCPVSLNVIEVTLLPIIFA